MNSALLYSLTGVGLFSIGLYGVIGRLHFFKKIIGLNIMGSGVFMLLVALAARNPDEPDPVPHVMVLTGIVVAVSATGLALALACHIHAATGQVAFREDEPQ